jgi:hypothetical protein
MSVSMLDIALASAWRPAPGDRLIAAVVHRETRTTEFGTYPVVYMAPVDGNGSLVAVHAFHQTLRDGLKALAPKRGQIVDITYAGLKESNKREDSKGNPVEYHHYVVLDPEDTIDSASDIDWDSPEF